MSRYHGKPKPLKWLALAAAVALLIAACPVAAAAQEQAPESGTVTEPVTSHSAPYMSTVLADESYVRGSDEISLPLREATGEAPLAYQAAVHGLEQEVLLSDETAGDITWRFTLQTAGWYTIRVRYAVMGSSGSSAARGVQLDGKVPYFEADSLAFDRAFCNSGETRVNSIGDEVRPSMEEVAGWQEITLRDQNGFYATPLVFPLVAGEHTVTLTYLSQTMAIAAVEILPYIPTESYAVVSAAYPNVKGEGLLTFQAEDVMASTNDPVVRQQSAADPSVQPPSDGYRVYNTLGGNAWRQGGQTVNFTFSVPADGLYRIALRVMQSWNDGIASHRTIAIDGKVPFSELETVRFDYNTRWQTVTLGDESGDFYFYLKEGEHTLSMTVTLGPLTEIVQTLFNDITLLSEMLLEISKLTGNDPDPNYDYQFFKYIPTLERDLNRLVDDIQEQYDAIYDLSGKATSMGSNFISIVKQLESMIKDPFTIAKRYNQLVQAQTNLGSWYLELQSQPLLIDEITVAAGDTPVPIRNSTLWQRIVSTWKNFILSFTKDYNNVGGVLDENTVIKDTIRVWIARGTEWAEVVKEMADSDFTPESGVQVNINVVPAAQLSAGSSNVLMLAITSGTAPDVVLGITNTSPVEFAIRDSVVDLSQFADFKKTTERFLPELFTPLTYGEGVYALPETMGFTCLFYRTDVLGKYNISVPNTRDELYNKTLPQLFENGLTYYQTPDYTPFLYQHGGAYYTEDGMKTALDTPEAYAAFKEYTEMFTHYSSPVNASFFNRFRTGEMPIGIGNYSLYLQLSTAAPELVGKWALAPLPGLQDSTGEINRSTGGMLGEVDMILKQDSDKKYGCCWEFLKWWSDEDVQRTYARENEAMVGVEARWNTANVNAFLSLDWNKQDLAVIREQWNWAKETPVVLGSAYAGRHVNNAFTSVVVAGNMSVRDALENAVKNINRELRTKQEEYGVYADKTAKGG